MLSPKVTCPTNKAIACKFPNAADCEPTCNRPKIPTEILCEGANPIGMCYQHCLKCNVDQFSLDGNCLNINTDCENLRQCRQLVTCDETNPTCLDNSCPVTALKRLRQSTGESTQVIDASTVTDTASMETTDPSSTPTIESSSVIASTSEQPVDSTSIEPSASTDILSSSDATPSISIAVQTTESVIDVTPTQTQTVETIAPSVTSIGAAAASITESASLQRWVCPDQYLFHEGLQICIPQDLCSFYDGVTGNQDEIHIKTVFIKV